MTKRMFTIIFATLGLAILCVAILALVLFVAPGLSVFGLKYIRTDTHAVYQKVNLANLMNGSEFTKSIRVEVDDMPVNVEFSAGQLYEIEYSDNYSGITNSKFDDPSMTITKSDDGSSVIKITSFKTFLFENANSKRSVTVRIPSSIVGYSLREKTSLTIISDKSDITFYKEKSDYFDTCFKDLVIETSGKINLKTEVKAINYSLKTMNSIKITDDNSSQINATNYTLESTGGNICVSREVSGNIKATTNNAGIKIISCKNFEASSGWGDVTCSVSDSKIKVDNATITTTAGKVEIGEILNASQKTTIKTKTGNVEVKKAYDIDIKTTRGHVNVVSARNLNVETGSGKIYVEEATSSISATSKRGKMTLGSSGTLVNPIIKSTYGDIEIKSASGTVVVETIESNVIFENKNSEDVTMKIGGALTANKLTGKNEITVADAANLTFENFTAATKITNSSGASTKINMLNNTISNFSFILSGSSATVFKYSVDDNQYSTVDTGSSIASGEAVVGKPKLTVESKGEIVVYCKYTTD